MYNKGVVMTNSNVEKTISYTFTDYTICSIAHLLWRFDSNKTPVSINGKIIGYSLYSSQTNISLFVKQEDYQYYKRPDKYALLMLLFLINKIPDIYSNNKLEITIRKKDLVDMFGIKLKHFSTQDCVDGLNQLMLFNISCPVKKNGEKKTEQFELIKKIEITKNSNEFKIILGHWFIPILKQEKYLANNFIQGTANYNDFIKERDLYPECMDVPQKILQLMRINHNKKDRNISYKNEKYFYNIFLTEKEIRSRLIEKQINLINGVLKDFNAKLVFDCKLTPTSFMKGNFKIVII